MASRRLARLASPRRFIPGKRSRFASGAEVPFVLGQAARASSAAAAAAAAPFNANLLPLGTNRTADCRCRARSSTSSARQPGRSQRVSPPVPRRSSPSPDSQVGGGGIGGGSLCGGGSDGDNDEYRWMHDADSDETLRHLEHENRYSAASLRPLRRRARELHRCMVSRQPEEEGGNRRSVPEQLGGYLYYTRRDEGKGFPVYVRRPVDGALGDEQTVLDMNEVEEHGLRGDHRAIGCSMHGEGSGDGERDCGEDKVEGYPSPSLGLMKLSPDQRMLACTVDLEGNDRFVLAVFDLEAGDGAQGDAVEAGAGAGMGKAAVLREDAMWDDVVGVEWGSSWPAAPGTDRGTTDGVTTDGGATDEGTGGDRCYGLYYTVPDDLRRPWQVRHVTIRTTRLTSVAAASCDDRENKRAIRDRARGRGGGGDGRKYGKRVSGGDGSGGRSVEEGWEVDSASDRIVFEEKDDAFFADVGKTKDGAFVVINVHSKTTSEVYFLPATNPTLPEMPPAHGHSDVRGVMAAATGRHGSRGGGGDHASGGEGGDWGTGVAGGGRRGVTGPTLLRHRRQGIEYYVDHSGDAFYLVTNSSASKNDDGGVGVQTAANAEAIAAGEYRLVRVIQPRGGDSLEGVADAPWEAVPYGRDASSSCSAGDAANGGKAAPNTHGEEGMLPEEVDRICRGLPLHRADGAEFELAAAAAAAACIKGGGGGSNGLGVLRGDYVGSKASAAQGRRGTIQEMDLFKDRCVLYESCPVTGSPQLRVVPLTGSDSSSSPSSSSSLPLPSASIVVSPPAPGGCHGGNVHGGSGGSGGRGSGSNNGSGSGTGTGTGSGTSISTGTGTGTGTNTGSGSGTRGGGGAAAVSGASTLRPGVNSWFDSRTARFSLSSPTAPEDVYDLCLESGGLELLRRTEVPGSPRFDGRDYSCYTIQVASHDGDKVPLTIAHRRGLDMNGGNRLLLHGYGSYGMTMPIDYQPGHACMLERGWVLAFAHVRGGGERGKAWHAAGRGLRKWNSFWDFEACAEHLISAGLTSSASMGVYVNSAGGLLGGVMANTRPGLFSAMVMKVPFLGVLSAMRNTSLPLTVHEFDEWGDPSSSQEVESMIRSYCPYENVREQEYPALLVTASTNDNRVNVWDPAKWVSRVRAVNTGKAPVLLRVSNTDGHHGPGNTLDSLRDAATEMAFLEQHLVPSEAVR